MYKVQMVLGKKESRVITYWTYAWGSQMILTQHGKILGNHGLVTIKFGKTCQVHDCMIL